MEVAKAAGSNELSDPTGGSVRQGGSRPRGGRILTVAQTGVTSQSSRTAEPVDNVESVEEALRRLWVKEGSKVTVGISCKPCLISGFVERRISQNTTDLSHEREELGEVVFLEEQQHGDLVPAGEAPLGNH